MTNYVKEEYIRKYADKAIVEALDKSIKDHLDYFIGCHKSFEGEEPDNEKLKELEEAAHKSALGWIDRNYYTQYNFDKSDPDYEHKMEMRKNYRNLIDSMSKEEIEKEDNFLKESEQKWNDFLKTLDFKDPDAWRAELTEKRKQYMREYYQKKKLNFKEQLQQAAIEHKAVLDYLKDK